MAFEGVMTNMTTGTVGGPLPEAPAPTAAEVLGQEAAPAPEIEAKPEPVVEKPRERSSDRFAALARKEAEVFRKQQAVRAQQAEIARQSEQIKAFEQAKRNAVLNPVEALKALGLTYEQITEYMLNDQKPTPQLEVQSVRQELEEFKRQAREEQRQVLEQQKAMAAQEQEQIISAFRDEVKDYVDQHAETYELTALYGGHSLVSDVIEEHFKQSGKLLTTPEAAKLVEEHYEDLARKAQATKKFAATQQKVASPQAPTTAQVTKIGPTLSNDLSATATATPKSPRSDADRIAAALARLEGR